MATYARGTARLVNGEATVSLGETFKWVTDPDIGLTAYLTPVGGWCDLYVANKETDRLTVRSRDGSDCTFDYLVFGLRIGFEESTILQEKEQDAYIPSMKDHRELAARRPELARYTALARWTTQSQALGHDEPTDLSRAHALRDRIGEYDPGAQGPIQLPVAVREEPEQNDREADRDAPVQREAIARPAQEGVPPAVEEEAPRAAAPTRDVYARSFRPAASDLASLLEVSEVVEPGDVVAIDPEHPGMLRRAISAWDPTVVGVVAAEPGVVLGSGSDGRSRAAVTFAGIATCRVDTTYGPVHPGDLLVSSPTPGHAMRADVAIPGTVLGKAMEELPSGKSTIRILVMPR